MKIMLGTGDIRVANVGLNAERSRPPSVVGLSAERSSAGVGTSRASSSVLARSVTNKTMRVVVRNAAGVEHSADLCSGFQRFIINIALRRAFLQISIRARAQFMMIDEGFGCLDDANLAQLCERLPELALDLQHVIIVSHIDYMRGSIETPIVIDTSGAQSVVQSGTMIDCATSVAASAETPSRAASAASAAIATKRPRMVRTKRVTAATIAPIDPAIIDRRDDGTAYCKICRAEVKILSRHLNSAKHAKKLADLRSSGRT